MPYDTDFDECAECGNHAVAPIMTAGYRLEECTYCGALVGSPEAVGAVADAREAVARGMSPALFRLERAISSIVGARVYDVFEGDAERLLIPYVRFHLNAPDTSRLLENLLHSLTLINHEAFATWRIEVLYAEGVAYALKPKLPPAGQRCDAHFIARTIEDVPVLARLLATHRLLSWWK